MRQPLFIKYNSEKGQMLLIMVLIMAVVLTVGLSTISRSVVDVKVSEQTEEAVRAFSAAEAGIEEALLTGLSSGSPVELSNSSNYNAVSTALPESSEINFSPIEINKPQSLWLSNPTDFSSKYSGSSLKILWGNAGDNPAIEVLVYYLSDDLVNNKYKVARFPFDPVTRDPVNYFCQLNLNSPANCAHITSFTTTTEKIDGVSYKYAAQINFLPTGGGSGLQDKAFFARIRLLYATTPQPLGVKASAGTNFLSQGKKYASTGQSGSSTRKVEVIRYSPAPPEIFDFALYSGGDLSKQ